MQILVVDDDPVGLVLASSVVAGLGHTAHVASDGEQAWQLIVQEQYDVVISDREMPGLDGLELCRRLRASALASPQRAYTYVVLLTGHDAYEDVLAGMLAGADDYLSKPLDTAQLRLRLIAAERVTELHARLQRQQAELAALSDAEHALARRDPLTGLVNRRGLQEELDRLDARARVAGPGYCLALLDLDHFRSYNDAVGHVAGDLALQQVAAALAGQVRPGDALFRYGGEELVLVVESTEADEAYEVVERLREAVRALALPHPGRPGQVLTLSAGLAGGAPGQQALLGLADTALHRAKSSGRNRTERADPTGGERRVAPAEARPLLDPAPLRSMHELGRRIGRDLAAEVVETYVRQSDARIGTLQTALDTRAAEALSRGAHALKGSSATIGATAVTLACSELEQAHLWERRLQLVDDLRTLATATNAALEAHLRSLLVREVPG